MAGFYNSNIWGPEPTMLAGDSTGNAMGLLGSSSTSAASSSGISMGGIGMGISVLGALAGGIGSFFSAKSQQSSLKFQSDMAGINAHIADTNARIYELGAQSALSQGNQQVGALTMRAGQLKSSQRASMAANGIDLGTGNAAEVQAGTDIMKDIDANTINANAVRSAWGYRTQAVNAQTQASNLRSDALMKSATAGAISPIGSAATSMLGSAGSLAQQWYALNKAGAFNSPSNGD